MAWRRGFVTSMMRRIIELKLFLAGEGEQK
jgi:hypothetical protein